MSAVVLVVELDLNPGQRETFLARARQHRDNVLENEPDCQRFDVVTADEDDNKVCLYEIYADEAAFQHHLATPYMKEYMEDTAPMIAQRRRIKCSPADA